MEPQMEPNKQKLCCICNGNLSSFEKTTVSGIIELLKFIILKVNCELLQDSIICETCLSKIEAAHKFKASYLDFSQNTSLSMVKEEPVSGNYIRCEICKSIISINGSIPLFDSESGLSLIKNISSHLELKMYKDFQSCESCYKSLINFYDITNSLSIFSTIDYVNVKEELQQSNVYSAKTNFKEMSDGLEDIKDEIEIKEFYFKTEVADFKINELESVAIERIGQEKERQGKFDTIFLDRISHEAEMYKCKICTFKSKYEGILKSHMFITHKNSVKVELLKCYICEFTTKSKYGLKNHMLIHKNLNEIEKVECHICDYKFKEKEHLKKHTFEHKNSKKDEMIKPQIHTFDYKQKSSHKNSDDEGEGPLKPILLEHNYFQKEVFICPVCRYSAKSEDTLKMHMISYKHHKHKNLDEAEMFKCHIKHKISNNVEIFKCHLCEFETKCKVIFKKHMIFHKNSTVIFQCQFCTYKTQHKSIIEKHMFVHNKIVPTTVKLTSENFRNTKRILHNSIVPTTVKLATSENLHKTKHKRILQKDMFVHNRIVPKTVKVTTPENFHKTTYERIYEKQMCVHNQIIPTSENFVLKLKKSFSTILSDKS